LQIVPPGSANVSINPRTIARANQLNRLNWKKLIQLKAPARHIIQCFKILNCSYDLLKFRDALARSRQLGLIAIWFDHLSNIFLSL
jgi:hypothetical protein